MLPLSVLSGSGRTRQKRLRRRHRRSSTLDRTCPKVPEFAAIGSRHTSGHGSCSYQDLNIRRLDEDYYNRSRQQPDSTAFHRDGALQVCSLYLIVISPSINLAYSKLSNRMPRTVCRN